MPSKLSGQVVPRYAKLAASLDMGEESRWQGFLQNKCR
jgi:hypothetical protein